MSVTQVAAPVLPAELEALMRQLKFAPRSGVSTGTDRDGEVATLGPSRGHQGALCGGSRRLCPVDARHQTEGREVSHGEDV